MKRLLPTILLALATIAGAQTAPVVQSANVQAASIDPLHRTPLPRPLSREVRREISESRRDSVESDPLQQFVQREAAAVAARFGGKVRLEITVGALPSGLQLAPCARIDPFLPGGVRLWGRARVGMRCIEGANWSVLVPVTVKIFGPALVASRPLPALQPIALDDLSLAEVEWTREVQGVATDASQIEARVLVRPISAGQPIPLAALRAPQVVGQGDPVKVLGQGRGFAIQTDGIALTNAQDGQPVRVRVESGRILTGTARAGRVVEVPL